jgi:hypothetical protein
LQQFDDLFILGRLKECHSFGTCRMLGTYPVGTSVPAAIVPQATDPQALWNEAVKAALARVAASARVAL